jgi:hypothetical protein
LLMAIIIYLRENRVIAPLPGLFTAILLINV